MKNCFEIGCICFYVVKLSGFDLVFFLVISGVEYKDMLMQMWVWNIIYWLSFFMGESSLSQVFCQMIIVFFIVFDMGSCMFFDFGYCFLDGIVEGFQNIFIFGLGIDQ